MFTLKRGIVSKSGMESTGELLILGFCPLVSVDASRHNAPLPVRFTPVILSLSVCSASVGFNDRHRECATIIGPSSDDIERKCVAAGINNGLLATGRIGGFGLRRVAGNLDWDGTEVVAIDFEDESVGIQRRRSCRCGPAAKWQRCKPPFGKCPSGGTFHGKPRRMTDKLDNSHRRRGSCRPIRQCSAVWDAWRVAGSNFSYSLYSSYLRRI